jgi:hypothetical protein
MNGLPRACVVRSLAAMRVDLTVLCHDGSRGKHDLYLCPGGSAVLDVSGVDVDPDEPRGSSSCRQPPNAYSAQSSTRSRPAS